MAEQYWKELRPSSAARFRLNVSIRHDLKPSDRDLRRPGTRSAPSCAPPPARPGRVTGTRPPQDVEGSRVPSAWKGTGDPWGNPATPEGRPLRRRRLLGDRAYNPGSANPPAYARETSGPTPGRSPATLGGRRRRGRACISSLSRKGRAGCGRPSCPQRAWIAGWRPAARLR